MKRRIDFDLWYVQHQSLALDLTILARTVVAEITRRTHAY
jgi:lipopolysaccharide/colanic/teichoic acid biosynthesis glycosyltransferase